jgi:hypothetical protein
VSKSFLRDFAYLANRYCWTPADIEEMKAAIRALRFDPVDVSRVIESSKESAVWFLIVREPEFTFFVHVYAR